MSENDNIQIPNYNLLGHDELESKYRALVKNGVLPPVILFHGRSGIGKKRLLKDIAQALLCSNKSACGECSDCKRVEKEIHPDLFIAETEASSLKIEVAKEIQEHLSLSTGTGKHRVVVISDVERMNEQAVNRLLKTFEEPARGSVILMSTSAMRSILDTLLSRSMKWLVRPPLLADFQTIVSRLALSEGLNQPSPANFLLLARKSGYSPAKAIDILRQQVDGDALDFKGLLAGSTNISASMDLISRSLKQKKVSAKEVVAIMEEQLNDFYRELLNSGKMLEQDNLRLKKRRELISNLRKATIRRDTPFNVTMFLEAVASC